MFIVHLHEISTHLTNTDYFAALTLKRIL